VKQQKSIERVGWKTFQVDGISFLSDCRGTLKAVEKFLQDAGVEPLTVYDIDDDEIEVVDQLAEEGEAEDNDDEDEPVVNVANDEDAIVISSDEDEEEESLDGDAVKVARRRRVAEVEIKIEQDEDAVDPSQYGAVANLGFLRGSEDSDNALSIVDDPYHPRHGRTTLSRSGVTDGTLNGDSNDEEEDAKDSADGKIGAAWAASDVDMQDRTAARGNDVVDLNSSNGNGVARAPRKDHAGDLTEDDDDDSGPPFKRQRRTRRLDKYSRDGRYYPGRKSGDEYEDDKKDWYDTDSDLPSKAAAKNNSPWLPDANAESDDED
jgi:hypothetical protein